MARKHCLVLLPVSILPSGIWPLRSQNQYPGGIEKGQCRQCCYVLNQTTTYIQSQFFCVFVKMRQARKQRHKKGNNKLQQDLWLSSDCLNFRAIKATECVHFVYWFDPDSTSWSYPHSTYWRSEWSICEKVKTISSVVDLLFKSFI